MRASFRLAAQLHGSTIQQTSSRNAANAPPRKDQSHAAPQYSNYYDKHSVLPSLMLAGSRIADHAPDQQLVNPNLHISLANQCFRGPARPDWTRLGNSIAAPTGTLGRAAIKIIVSAYGYKPVPGIGYSLDIEAARGRGAGLEPCPPILQTGVVGDSSTM
jgi:hypothetical protein